ncbi:hypothetical protein MCOR25_000142 [Pyricularia grisea]|uniref:Methyltransferase type 11 domain-containing protein n=1 Tax=Pyricularia grisea TaxID=148305 RepID=A0A6P8BJ97_PYRGI|nr:uncharacterized protein PgNI_02374 [Pyricularia grisea]KAI6383221.1 hypothetical protein MCOR25_000142 [Pyricularia grisea]TLD16739.1 hypothetical protein PgNI_02374 [Pyricularia grisea]
MAADTEELAKGYTVNNVTQKNTGLFLLDRLIIKPGMHILDVGCGPGNITAHIAKLVGPTGSVAGIDPSKERIALAQELIATAPNLSFSMGFAEDLSRFANASFDIVYVNSTFHWIADQAAAMREFNRVLKPGGRLGISGGSGDSGSLHRNIKVDVLSREPFCQYPDTDEEPRFLKRVEMEKLLGDANFIDYNMTGNTIIKRAKDGNDILTWLDTSSSGKLYGGIPPELKEQAKDAMRLEWDKLKTEDGIKLEIDLLVTVATKT